MRAPAAVKALISPWCRLFGSILTISSLVLILFLNFRFSSLLLSLQFGCCNFVIKYIIMNCWPPWLTTLTSANGFLLKQVFITYVIVNMAETLASDLLGKKRRPHDWTFGLRNIRACAHFEGNARDWIFLKFNAKFLIEEFPQKMTFHTSF